MAETVGAAQSDLADLLGGALGKRSVELAQYLTPEPERFDPAIAAMKFFSNMAAEASKPGATVIGSAAGSVKPVVDDYTAMLQRNRKLKATEGPLAINLFDKLKGTTTKKEYIDLTKVNNPKTPNDERIVKLTDTEYSSAGTNIVSLASMKAGVDAESKGLDKITKLSNNYKGQRSVEFYQKLRSTYQKIEVAYNKAYDPDIENPQVADVSMIFNYMKMLDPGSTVREGEYATAKNTAGIGQGLRNSYNAAWGGGFLSDGQRADFRDTAWDLINAEASNVQKINENFTALGEKFGISTDNILEDLSEYGSLKKGEDGEIKWTSNELTSGVNLITLPSNAELAVLDPADGGFTSEQIVDFLDAPNVINNPKNLAKIYNAQYDRIGSEEMVKELIELMGKSALFKATLAIELKKLNGSLDFRDLYPLPEPPPIPED